MIDRIALWDRTVVLDGVDIVVGRANTQRRFQQTGSNEHQSRWDNQLLGLSGNQQRALIGPCCDLNHSAFQRGFVQVSSSRRAVAVGATRDERVSRREQGNTITVSNSGVEAVVNDSSSLDLLRVRHTASQSLSVTSRQAVVQVVFHRFFSDGETQGNGFVVVASGPSFLTIVISNGRAFVLHRSGREARQLGFLFKRAFRGLGVVDFLMLFAVTSIFQTKQCVQPRQEFFK